MFSVRIYQPASSPVLTECFGNPSPRRLRFGKQNKASIKSHSVVEAPEVRCTPIRVYRPFRGSHPGLSHIDDPLQDIPEDLASVFSFVLLATAHKRLSRARTRSSFIGVWRAPETGDLRFMLKTLREADKNRRNHSLGCWFRVSSPELPV